MIRLTDFDTGREVYIRPEVIMLIVQLPASVCENAEVPKCRLELPERTKIETVRGTMLVRESASEVTEMIGAAK